MLTDPSYLSNHVENETDEQKQQCIQNYSDALIKLLIKKN
jgi:hypothetical protein